MATKINPKVAAGGAAGALVTIIVWAAGRFAGVEVPADVAMASTVLVSFAAGYFTSDRKGQHSA